MLNQRALQHVKDGQVRAAEAAFTQAEFMHDECKGCYCQHRTR